MNPVGRLGADTEPHPEDQPPEDTEGDNPAQLLAALSCIACLDADRAMYYVLRVKFISMLL